MAHGKTLELRKIKGRHTYLGEYYQNATGHIVRDKSVASVKDRKGARYFFDAQGCIWGG